MKVGVSPENPKIDKIKKQKRSWRVLRGDVGRMWGLGGQLLVLSTVYDAMQAQVRGRGELSPSKLSTILSTLQCSLQCSGRTTCSIELLRLQCNTIVSTIDCILRAFSILLSHYLVPITFSLLSLSRHYHFLATARLEFPPSLC